MVSLDSLAFITTKVLFASNRRMGRGSGENGITGAAIDTTAATTGTMTHAAIHHHTTPKHKMIGLFSRNDDEKGDIIQGIASLEESSTASNEKVATFTSSVAKSQVSTKSSATDKETSISPIHFCFIVHGHNGRPTDLAYLHHTVKDKAMFMNATSSGTCVVGAASKDSNVDANVVTTNPTSTVSDAKYNTKHWIHAIKESNAAKKLRRKKRDRFPPPQSSVEPEPSTVLPIPQHESLLRASSDATSHDARKKENDDEVDQHGNQKMGNLEPTIVDFVESSSGDAVKSTTQSSDQTKNTFIVHNAVCNKGRTHDGIEKGGERLTNEILDVIRQEVRQHMQLHETGDELRTQQEMVDVTISLVGNSLGGLYARYAVARLAETLDLHHVLDVNTNGNDLEDDEGTEETHYLLDGNIRVHFNVFCSTAAPHLGCANHTYFAIPRLAEIGVAHALGETGRDLFRLNDLIHTMATSPRFLRPLAAFKKRIAYANAFGTDFPVPGSTAAFLDHDSDYPHYFDEYFEETNDKIVEEIGKELGTSTDATDESISGQKDESICPATERGLVVAIFQTPRLPLDQILQNRNGKTNDMEVMSSSLDSLGWKKVFIDIRKEIPLGLNLPTLLPTARSKSEPNHSCPIQKLKPSRVVESRVLASAVSQSQSSMDRISLPLGHNALCAFSRGTVSTMINSGGRHVMDSLAIDLTNEISLWNGLN